MGDGKVLAIELGVLYRTIFEQSPEPMWLFDEETLRFLDVNNAAVEVYGYSREEFLEMGIAAIRSPEDAPRLLNHRHAGGAPRGDWKHRKKSGTIFDVEVVSTALVLDGRTVHLSIARDVSSKVAREEQLRHAQKIETVGQLAGGIARDFNNLLMAILGHVEVLSDYLAPGDPRAAEVSAIREAANLGASLTRQLVAFSREQQLQPTTLNVNDVVTRARPVLQRLVGELIDIETYPAAELWCVRADAGQIEQIIVNLSANARDAMPDGGVLTIRTANVTMDTALARVRSVAAGDYVELSVADTGIGIDPAVRVHLFEPFFTTKKRDGRTGLGLATVYGIVKQSGGHIDVESEEARGSRFAIYLPATRTSAATALPHRAVRSDRGSETVLVVEDDQVVRTLVGDVLRRRGYQLLEAENGAQALRLADEHRAAIHLVIAARTTPGMSGVAVASALRARRPETRMLFLDKPFKPEALARKVRDALLSRN